MSNYTTVFCDMDDTLIPNNYAYYLAGLEATRLILIDLGTDAPNPIEVIQRATHIQAEDTKELGYISEQCFPISYMKAYIQICEKIGKPVNKAMRDAIAIAGMSYILKEYKLYPGIVPALNSISQNKILVTRGNEKVQKLKIEQTNLASHFNHIEIVPIKTKQTFEDLLDKYQLDPKTTIMIGDSIRNDIQPALEAGLHTIHIEHPHVNWDWEASLGEILLTEEQQLRNRTAKSFVEAVGYIEQVNQSCR